MASLVPIKFWSLRVPADGMVVGLEETETGLPNMQVRITMAAIDPTAEPEVEGDGPKLSTLKIIHAPTSLDGGFMDGDSDDFSEADSDEEGSEDDSEEEEESEDENEAGPSNSKAGSSSSKAAKKAAAAEELKKIIDEADAMDMDGEIDALIKKAKGKAKAKAPKEASSDDDEESSGDDDEDDDEDDDDEGLEIEEAVVCTLDPLKMYQQPLDIVIGEEEQVFFKAVGAFPIFLTGNYVVTNEPESVYDPDSEEEDSDVDLSPDEEDLLNGYGYSDEESDDLDDLGDPRIMELDEDEDDEEKAAQKVNAIAGVVTATKNLSSKEKKSAAHAARVAAAIVEKDVKEEVKKATPTKKDKEEKEKSKKRPAEESTDDLAKTDKRDAAEQKLSKKQLKKLKANSGEAAPAPTDSPATEAKKKVQFAANLETGPTPNGNKSSPAPKPEKPTAATETKKASEKKSSRVVDGVTIEDHTVGTGPECKKGNKVSMRYVGKLQNGKVFDSNKKGKPFQFKLGAGEVIKGWDIGVAGMKAGGERKLIIPASHAYGSSGAPGIPKNSTLIFEVKLLEIK